MSSHLVLHFLGPPQLYLNQEPVVSSRRKATALLAFLALHGGRQTRDSLSGLFWPDYDQSRAFSNLRHILWEVQQVVGDGRIVADRETVSWNPEAELSVDVREFESLLAKVHAQSDAASRISLLMDAVKLYRGHFLTGFSLKDAPDFNDWAFAKAEDLKHQFGRALATLSEDYCLLGKAEQAIPYARRLITLDPLNEASHRRLMQAYIQAGQHSAALKQYQACEQILRKELGLDPQPETRDLYKKIRKREIQPVQVERQKEKQTSQHNLPRQLSSFIGRDREQQEIINLLAKNRLVTLLGAGGIGKTSLSLQVGQKLLSGYPSGVWFIGLDSLADPALITQTTASVFGLREGPDQPLLEKLTDFLLTKTTLLIFDNCEHLLDASAQLITTLLTRCLDLKILATSREHLRVSGEALYTMPALSLPEQSIRSVEQLGDFESVQLFAERAALALTSFRLTAENIQTVVDLCRRVDGIPLAIELAAARVNILQVGEILGQLQNSFSLLASDARTVMPRHQTLRASMNWSWGLLSEAEQTILCQLSVFAGGWTLQAAQQICDGDILGLTDALVKKSLIVVDQKTGRETRYRFHEMVREFARDKLVESGQEDIIRTRHLNYVVGLTKQAERELRGPALMSWIERLSDERNNLRAALHWADKTNVEAGLSILGRLRRYWESSDLREGTGWLEQFLHKPASREFPLARAQALLIYGWLLTWLQKFAQAQAVTEESLEMFQAVGDRVGETDALVSLGNIAQFRDDMDAASELIHRSLALARTLNDPWREANAYYFLGWDRRNFRQAMQYWEKALPLYRSVGDQVALTNVLGMLGQFMVMYGDLELGEKYLDEAMPLSLSTQRANIWENVRIAKSLIALMRGDVEEARALLREASDAIKVTGNKMADLWVRVRLSYVELHAGNLDQARDMLLEIARSFHKDSYVVGSIFALEGIAALFVEKGHHLEAARLIGLADRTREKIKDKRPLLEQVDVDRVIDACLIKIGEAAFSDAYDQGTEMTIDEAIALAQKELFPSASRPHRKTDRSKRQSGNGGTPGEKVQKEG